MARFPSAYLAPSRPVLLLSSLFFARFHTKDKTVTAKNEAGSLTAILLLAECPFRYSYGDGVGCSARQLFVTGGRVSLLFSPLSSASLPFRLHLLIFPEAESRPVLFRFS